MTIRAPHFFDVADGKLKLPFGSRIMLPHAQFMTEMREKYEKADKFDFGDLSHLMTDRNEFAVPLTHEERLFWAEKLIPLPNPESTYFEYTLGQWALGFLVSADPDWTVTRFEWGRSPNDDAQSVFASGLGIFCEDGLDWANGGAGTFSYFGDGAFFKRLSPDEQNRFRTGLVANLNVTIYLALMLNSKSTDVEKSEASPKLNKARAKAGRAPFPTHHIVTLTPKRFISNEDGSGGTHASPRLHWRRSHLRTLRNEAGEIHKRIVIPRHLVGKRELGEITHEYRVTRA